MQQSSSISSPKDSSDHPLHRTMPQYSSHRNRTEACACASTTGLSTNRPSRTSTRFHESMISLTSFGEPRYFRNQICGPDTGRYEWRTILFINMPSELDQRDEPTSLGTLHTRWDNDIAYRKGSTKIWVPYYPPLRQLLLEEYHDVLYAGHFGSNKTFTGIASHYYWPHTADDVQKFITSCTTCQRMKSSKKKKADLLQPLPVPEQPWQVVSLDFITGLPTTTSGHDAILVVISKMSHFIPTHTTARTEETAQLFVRYIISQHGIPTTLISDRDPNFTSKLWRELMSLLGTKLTMSSAYHPQIDGQTGRFNQIVEQLFRAACKDEISKWNLHLPVLELAYNNATYAATGQTPFFLCYGRQPLTPQQPNVPATVQLVTPVTFRLRLPATWKIHNAFHVQILKPYRDPNAVFSGRQPPPPPPVLVYDEPEYEVESVLAHRRRRNGTVELLIRWKGYYPSEDSWVSKSNMDHARRPLRNYLVKQGVRG
ncbi:hypothetical protein CLOM_g23524 [Closterium sp. NIES-68]|nr:hypothetical protein CLOM_g23524 [Closterium sp. NIES-68]